jgi:hypothetical protein
MSYLIIGGTNVLFDYRWDKCRGGGQKSGGRNVGGRNVCGTYVCRTKVAPPDFLVTVKFKWDKKGVNAKQFNFTFTFYNLMLHTKLWKSIFKLLLWQSLSTEASHTSLVLIWAILAEQGQNVKWRFVENVI